MPNFITVRQCEQKNHSKKTVDEGRRRKESQQFYKEKN